MNKQFCEIEEGLKSAGYNIIETAPGCFRWRFDDGLEICVWSDIVWNQVAYDPILTKGVEKDSRDAKADAVRDAVNDAIQRGLLSA